MKFGIERKRGKKKHCQAASVSPEHSACLLTAAADRFTAFPRTGTAPSPRCFASKSWMPRSSADTLKSPSRPPNSLYPFFRRCRAPPVRRSNTPPPFHLASIHLATTLAIPLRIRPIGSCWPKPPESPECHRLPRRRAEHRHEPLTMASPLWHTFAPTLSCFCFALSPCCSYV